MSVPQVVIVGRPNVGKSSLLNWLAGRLVSVVDPTAGVTRDRVASLFHEGDRYFELVDTGGIGIVDSDDLSADIERQIEIAIEEADLILFVVDGRTGVTPLDREVAERIRRLERPTLLVVNKCDSEKTDTDVYEFLTLMDVPLVRTSVKGNRNRKELRAAILEHLPPARETETTEGAAIESDPELKLAIVGRRNVGKSTFINALAETDRMIVSEVAGTTRDSVDVRFDLDGKSFVAIDTPGVRKKKSLANDIEFYGLVRAQKSIRRADVVLMFFDASKTISQVDKQLVEFVRRYYKPCIFVVNKWDLGLEAEMTAEKWADYLAHTFGSLPYVPVAFITARDSRNIKKLINLTQELGKQARIRVSTGRLNKVVRAAVDANPPPSRRNRLPRVFFAVQVAVQPPTIVVKCNDARLFDEPWKRYLLNTLRDDLPYPDVPIKLYLRTRGEDENPEEASPSNSSD
ncbi:MAG: ribosome biogenesis GTPase Der [Planctomycetota bacterium]|nr:MAG: ribosome biogenesis GTPase Der [Planctomycetota bacterium]REJ95100.1 MAG: ribosome biogenesis GTPase Der [Planctomycetota bacterium]REK21184.1 MAG: ribosome biogenesis GTPase Der [Planctomycetota bacterium]REK29592.1 MAG: ribosome biogenesis GTPase Der [Planctomycetota bacterium]